MASVGKNSKRRVILLVTAFLLSICIGYAVSSKSDIAGIFERLKTVVKGKETTPTPNNDRRTEALKRPSSEKPGTPEVTTSSGYTLTVYYPNETAELLVAESREFNSDKPSPADAIKALADGPRDPSHGRALPKGTEALSVKVKNGVAEVNFNEAIRYGPGGSTGEVMLVYSVVHTLDELPGISKVRFMVEGEAVNTLYGHLDLSQPIAPDPSLVDDSAL